MGPFSFGSKIHPGFAKLIEESGELGQVMGKFVQTDGAENHWDGTNLRDRLAEEAADLYAALDFMLATSDVNRSQVDTRRRQKLLKFWEWHDQESYKAKDKEPRQ